VLFLLGTQWAMGQNYLEHVNQGNAYYDSLDYASALDSYKSAAELNEKGFEAQFNLGDVFFKQESFEEAAIAFETSLNLTEDKLTKAEVYFNLGNTYVRQKEYEKALDAYKKSLRNNPKDHEARYNLARLRKMLYEETKENGDNNNDQDKKKNEPTEFALALKKQCDELVEEFKFKEAYDLMVDGAQKDETVKKYQEFIMNLKDVVEIDEE
jgi:tetratricopeptide (TPR) repeat protein